MNTKHVLSTICLIVFFSETTFNATPDSFHAEIEEEADILEEAEEMHKEYYTTSGKC